MLNDRQLVTKIKKTKNNTDYSILYRRYLPMIDKYGNKIRATFQWQGKEVRDDFRQDAYIALVKAVDYVDLDKIRDDMWTFKIVFYYFLKTLQCSFFKDIIDNNIKAESITLYQEALENPNPRPDNEYLRSTVVLTTISETLGVTGNHYSEFLDIRNQFDEKITDRQREILELRQEGFTIAETSQYIGVSFGTVHRDIKKAKKVFQELVSKNILV